MPGFSTPAPGSPATLESTVSFSNFYTMFPNAGPQQLFAGFSYEFHGDIRMVAWDFRVITNTGAKIELELLGQSKALPFQIKRTLTLVEGSAELAFSDEISHTGPAGSEKLPYIYGFHPYFTFPLLDQGAQFKVGGQTILELPSRHEPLSKLFSVETGPAGVVEVYNPALPAAFRLKVDSAFLKYTWLWFVSKPAENVYLGSILPCTNYIAAQEGINAAISNGTASWLAPGHPRSTSWGIEVAGPV